MKIEADLHCHTTMSDGSETIPQVIRAAQKTGLKYIAITNHDTTKGLSEAYTEGKKQGITVIGGIEISAYDFKRGRKVHILGYNLQENAPHTGMLCTPLLEARNRLSHEQIKILNKYGFPITQEEAEHYCKDSGILYKQHIMQVLVDKKITNSIYSNLYYCLFKNEGPASKDIVYVDAADAVTAVKDDGGFAVLAHPGQMNSWDIVPELLEKGLDGIEKYHQDHTSSDREKVDSLIERYGLFVTGGSDFHGKFSKKHTRIGECGCAEKEIDFFIKNRGENL